MRDDRLGKFDAPDCVIIIKSDGFGFERQGAGYRPLTPSIPRILEPFLLDSP